MATGTGLCHTLVLPLPTCISAYQLTCFPVLSCVYLMNQLIPGELKVKWVIKGMEPPTMHGMHFPSALHPIVLVRKEPQSSPGSAP